MTRSLDDLALTDDARLSLSWDFLWRQVLGAQGDVAADVVGDLVRAALSEPIADEVLREIELCEAGEGRSLARIRARHPHDDPRPKLGVAETEAFLLATMLGARDTQRREAWEILVRAGMDPTEAVFAARNWKRSSGVLPTGQIISDEAVAAVRLKGPESFTLRSGHTLDADEAREVYEIIERGNKIEAIRRLRELTGSGLGEAKNDMESMASGNVIFGDARREAETSLTHDPRARLALDVAIESLLVERPFHWAILAAATIVEDGTHSTMAVGLTRRGELMLFYNPDFTLGLTLVERMAVLAHEVNHVVFGHLTPPAEAGVARDAWVLACEATANEFVPWKLPGEPVTCASLGLPRMESTITRFHALRVRDDLPKVYERDFVLGTLRRGATQHGDLEAGPGSYPWQLVRAAGELVGEEIDADTVGSLGAAGPHIADALDALLSPEGAASLPWTTLLRQLATSLNLRQSTLRWPSRRAPDRVGVVPGRRARRERPVILVAIDTSASMSVHELSQIATEVTALTSRDLRVACVQCDTEVRQEGWLASGDTLRRAVGRGGTDLRPPFGAEVLRRYDPAALVYFTDGEGAAPSAAPPGVDVLWVLTGMSPIVPARWGRVACLRPRNQRQRVRPPR
ncbi:MAG: VWA-like domain-containing protein [Polyangiales bacterium]